AEDGIRDRNVTGVQTCALPILSSFMVFQTLRSNLRLCVAQCQRRLGRLHLQARRFPVLSDLRRSQGAGVDSDLVNLALEVGKIVAAPTYEQLIGVRGEFDCSLAGDFGIGV